MAEKTVVSDARISSDTTGVFQSLKVTITPKK